MKTEPNFIGKDGFFWFIGVVEDRQDPKKLGRLRVRILGAHTENKQLIPTNELHWAYPYQPLTWNLAMNGLGHSPTGPVEGSWVFGFFLDGQSAQDPVILGTIAGVPEEAANPQIGFYDPGKPFHNTDTAPRKIKSRYYPNDGTGAQIQNENAASLYPRASQPWGCIIGESDVNRLARAENVSDTIIGVQQRQLDVGIKGEFGGIPIAFVHPTPERKWTEPQSAYNAAYPYNHVYESESGHVIEIDDTPGSERIHLAHRTLTRIEIDQEGNLVIKVVGKKFEVTMENSYSHFQNTMNLTVDGECNIYCRNDANLQVDGNLNVHVQGDYTEKVHGNYFTDIDGNRTTKIGGNDDLEVSGNHTTHVGGTSDRESTGPMYDIAGGQVVQSAGGGFMMAASGELSADAPAVFFNSQKGSVQSVTAPVAPVVPTFPAPLNNWTETINETGTNPVKETKPDPNPNATPPYVESGQQLVVKYDSPTPPTPQAHIDLLKAQGLYVEPTKPIAVDATTPLPAPSSIPPMDCPTFKTMTEFPSSLVLSPNFTLGDLTNNTVISHATLVAQVGLSKGDIVCNLQALAVNCLEPIAAKYGRKNMIITSAFRPDTGGSSQHIRGQAADIQFPGISDQTYFDRAIDIKNAMTYDQLILEYLGSRPWIHISYNKTGAERRMPLTAASQGVYKPGIIQMR